VDLVDTVLDRARRDAGYVSNIIFERMEVPREWPKGDFDLIVLSEVLYYLSPSDLERTADLAAGALTPDGVIILVNWLGTTAAPHSGDEAAEAFIRAMQPVAAPVLQTRAPLYRLDMLAR
jgi:predicted TPR repeat methyltransferase